MKLLPGRHYTIVGFRRQRAAALLPWVWLALLLGSALAAAYLPGQPAGAATAIIALLGLGVLAPLLATRAALLVPAPAAALPLARAVGAAQPQLAAASATQPAAPDKQIVQRIAELTAIYGEPHPLPALAERGCALLGTQLACIASYDPATADVIVQAAHGPGTAELLGQRLSWPGLSDLSGPLFVANAQGTPQLAPIQMLLQAAQCPAAALLPLRSHDQLLGVLVLAGQPGEFNAETQLLAQILAGLATGALMQALLRAQASQAARTRAAILDTISHEFRTPITVILGFTELYQEGVLGAVASDEQHEALGAIHRNTHRLLKLVDGMLDLARVEAGEIELQAAPVRLSVSLNEALVPFQEQLTTQQIIADWRDDELPTVWADAQWLRRALIGALTFALESALDQPIRVQVRRAGPKAVLIELLAPGVALRVAEQADFFDTSRADDSGWRGSSMARLGLELSRRTLALLGGELSVEYDGTDTRLIARLRIAL